MYCLTAGVPDQLHPGRQPAPGRPAITHTIHSCQDPIVDHHETRPVPTRFRPTARSSHDSARSQDTSADPMDRVVGDVVKPEQRVPAGVSRSRGTAILPTNQPEPV